MSMLAACFSRSAVNLRTLRPQPSPFTHSLSSALVSYRTTQAAVRSQGVFAQQQRRGARWESYTKADYGSKRGNTYRNSSQRQSFFSGLTPESAVYLLIGANGIMFLVWTSANQRFKSLGDASMLTWLTRNCSTMWANLVEGRIWTLVTPAFSHVDPMHLFVNMFVLHSFGSDVARLLGPRRFLGFYLGAAVVGNLVSAVIRGVVIPLRTGDVRSMTQPSIGASTSVIGITTLFACVYPMAQLQLFMIIPVRAWLATVGFVGWDLWRVVQHGSSKADGAGHLGGAAAGLAYNDVLSTGIGGSEYPTGDGKQKEEEEESGDGAKQEEGGGGGGSSESGSSKDRDSKDGSGDSDGDSSGSEDDGVVRCVCLERNDGELMIQCEICQVWQHTLCMGIRDAAHIPDKYYCEKCHPEDHPYINSRPRTTVLAEASALSASSMMRRSAVMAVAKMTAREEYRSASAAAAIAASVAAAATQSPTKTAPANGRRAPAKKTPATPKKAEASSSRRTPRRSRKAPPPAQRGSEDDYDERRPSETPATDRTDEPPDRAPKGTRKAQTPKRPAQGGGGSGKRRRVDGDFPPPPPPGVEDVFAEDLVARIMGNATDHVPRNRSISTVAGPAVLLADGDRRRGKSEPGSPTQQSPPPVFADGNGESDPEDRLPAVPPASKRRRVGGKALRMTVSAANSPSLGNTPTFGEAAPAEDGVGSAEDDAQPAKHSFPALETEDADGRRITVPPSMLNAQGQPVYSSVTADTMCRIRYPHARASMAELSRRAKQLLEWLGKAQSEYEHERLAWLPPLTADPPGARAASQALSDAPTSPINPSDWPADDLYDAQLACAADEPNPADQASPRSTLSMMEDLMWRLIRFQETYSN
ncbi:hypothetical protein GGI20_004568 [Coemansia sp. BCRC 34301]|nr:hypothetical protein GGI20_004568 [Coemansia sp. BCRC 34301]